MDIVLRSGVWLKGAKAWVGEIAVCPQVVEQTECYETRVRSGNSCFGGQCICQ